MVKENARTQKLMRERDRLKRSRQVWLGATIAWAALVGWVLWGAINTITDSAQSGTVWLLAYLLPVVVLGSLALIRTLRLRRIDTEIEAIAEQVQRGRATGG